MTPSLLPNGNCHTGEGMGDTHNPPLSPWGLSTGVATEPPTLSPHCPHSPLPAPHGQLVQGSPEQGGGCTGHNWGDTQPRSVLLMGIQHWGVQAGGDTQVPSPLPAPYGQLGVHRRSGGHTAPSLLPPGTQHGVPGPGEGHRQPPPPLPALPAEPAAAGGAGRALAAGARQPDAVG